MSVKGDPRWPSAASLLTDSPVAGRPRLSLLGVHTHSTSVTPRSSTSTPAAVRAALERFSTYSFEEDIDLCGRLDIVDHGDVRDPDGPEGLSRVRQALDFIDLSDGPVAILGGDNAATYAALSSIASDDPGGWGLITLDAHLDIRDGWSNGSPVRQLLEFGLDGHRVVQIGLADFSNSGDYTSRARDAGLTFIPRSAVRSHTMESVVQRALSIAGAGDRPVYVDIDLDVVDQSAVPGCPAAAPGGLSPDQLRHAARLLASDPRVKAIDLTEVDVERDDSDQRTVRLMALALLEICVGVARRPQ